MLKRLISVFLLLCSLSLTAQNNFLRHYSINEGLPSSETYMAFQDSKGYIWIASDLGVSRFDGYNFTVYTTNEGLTDNVVFSFFEDPKGRIWFNTFSGRLCYFQNDSIYGKNLEVNEQLHKLLGQYFITSIRVDSNDTILLGTHNGLYKISPIKNQGITTWRNKIERITDKQTFPVNNIYITSEEPTAGTTLLIKYYPNGNRDSTSLPFPASWLISLRNHKDGSLVLFYSLYTVRLSPTGKITMAKHLEQGLEGYSENDSLIWIGQKRHGLHLYNINNLNESQKDLLEEFSVTSVLKDHENGYWFTTLEDGLFYLPSSQFRYFPPAADSMLYSESSLFNIDTNRVWLATRSKLFESKNNSKFKEVSTGLLKKLPYYNKIPLWNGLRHSDGNIWISTGAGLAVLNSKGALVRFVDFFKNTPTLEIHSHMAIEDHAKNIWSLNHSTLTQINHINGEILQIIPLPSRATRLVEDSAGHILVATTEGLYCFFNDSLHFLGSKNEVFRQRFTDLQVCDGNLVAATKSTGVIIVSGDSIYHITISNGLSTNMCRSICIDGPGKLWIGTNRGLNSVSFSLKPFNVHITQYTVADGLLNNDIDQVIKNNNTIWLRSKKGITAFNPLVAITNTVPPPIYITLVKINNTPHPVQGETTFNYGASIDFDFTGLNFKNAGKQNYKYKLEGIDTAWTYSTNTSVQFSRLPPGNFTFKVFCINNSGIESKEPAYYRFTINAPFYKKWWFSILVFIIGIGCVIVLAALIVRRIRKQEEAKTDTNRKIANYELQALRAQMNPHFVFNCLNAIQDFILSNDAESARRYLSSFSKLIRKTLNHSRRHEISLQEEAEFVQLYLGLEKMRFDNRFDFFIHIDTDLLKKDVQIPSMIIQPFVENAVKHGKIGSMETQGVLKIDFLLKDNELVCIIDDNGIGLDASLKMKRGNSSSNEAHAMDIMNDRMRTISEVNNSKIRYTIIDKSNTNTDQTGTHAEIYIPLT